MRLTLNTVLKNVGHNAILLYLLKQEITIKNSIKIYPLVHFLQIPRIKSFPFLFFSNRIINDSTNKYVQSTQATRRYSIHTLSLQVPF